MDRKFLMNTTGNTGAGQRSERLLPAVAAAMDAQGYKRVSELYRAFAAIMDTSVATDRKIGSHGDYQNFLHMTEGREHVFMKELPDYTMRASMLAAFLKVSPEKLFGAPESAALSLDRIENMEMPVLHDGFSAPESALIDAQTRKKIEDALSKLTAREINVLSKLYGLNGEEAVLGDVAVEYGCTRERARQIEAKALRKMKHNLKSPQMV